MESRAEISETEMKKAIEKINEVKKKNWFCENIDKTNKPLARFIKKERERAEINNEL